MRDAPAGSTGSRRSRRGTSRVRRLSAGGPKPPGAAPPHPGARRSSPAQPVRPSPASSRGRGRLRSRWIPVPRGLAVRGVADQERAALCEAIRDLRREAERGDRVESAARGRGLPPRSGSGVSSQPRPAARSGRRRPRRPSCRRGPTGRRRSIARVDDGIQAVPRFAYQVPERRRERCADGKGVSTAPRPTHLDVKGASDGAVGPVGADHVPRAHTPDAIAVPDQGLGAVIGNVDSQDLAAELRLGPERAGVTEVNRLGVVLRRAEGRRGAQHAGLLLRRQAEAHDLAPGRRRPGSRLRAKPLHVRKAASPDPLLEPTSATAPSTEC